MGGIPDRLLQGGPTHCPPQATGTGVFWEQANRQELVADIAAGEGEQEIARINFASTPNNSFIIITTNFVAATTDGVIASLTNYVAAKIVDGSIEIDPDDPGFFLTISDGAEPEGPAELEVEGQDIVISWLMESGPSRVSMTINSFTVVPGYDLQSRVD